MAIVLHLPPTTGLTSLILTNTLTDRDPVRLGCIFYLMFELFPVCNRGNKSAWANFWFQSPAG